MSNLIDHVDVSRCRSCGAPIYWLKNASTGKLAPVDVEPSDKGNILAYLSGVAYPAYDLVNRAAADEVRKNQPLRTNHFMTCPSAKQWKRHGSRSNTEVNHD